MRIIFLIIVAGIIFTLALPVLAWAMWDQKRGGHRGQKTIYAINRMLAVIVLWGAGAKITAKGTEYLESEQGGVQGLIVSNHKSMIDILLLMRYHKGRMTFISKDGVLKWPVISWYMKTQGTLFLNRTSAKDGLKVLRAAIALLKAGETVVIFPEGTRSKTDALLPFKEGSVRVAEKSGVPVIPCAIKGTETVFEDNGFNLKPGNIQLTVGEPIYFSEVTLKADETFTDYVAGVIENMLSEMA